MAEEKPKRTTKAGTAKKPAATTKTTKADKAKTPAATAAPSAAKKPATARAKTAAAPRAKKATGIEDLRQRLIIETAYFVSEKRRGECGELDDWLFAETLVDSLIGELR